MRRRAFTLVELLVVIAIIGLLSTIAIISTANARMASRNVRRNADIAQYLKAFSLANDANGGVYPLVQSCVSVTCGGAWSGVVANAGVDNFFSPYFPNKPTDPPDAKRTVTGYVYNGAFSGTAPYDGYIYSSVPVVSWFMETPSNITTICGAGRVWSTTATQTQCFLILNQ